jgi:hypothetical protein
MMRSRYLILINSILLLAVDFCSAQKKEIPVAEQALSALTEVMMHDITSPPVASRDYVYTLIAYYEATRPSDKRCKSYSNHLKGLEALPQPEKEKEYDWEIAGLTAFYKTAYALVFSKELFKEEWQRVENRNEKKSVSPAVKERSIAFGEQVAEQVLQWAKTDNYLKTRGLQRYTVSGKPGSWQQTAPDFMEALEPYWNQLRPMVLTRPDTFLCPVPAAFGSEKFKASCKEVYDKGNTLTPEETKIANFWDCNPFATQTVGHLMYSVKKISPAGHWIGITGVAIRKSGQPPAKALQIYSIVAIAMYDAIIAAWDEKYRSNYIRPVSAIQQLYSPTWQPLLQTPPFPEYPSGHSVISMAAASILTRIFGNQFNYVDDVELPYGLPSRSFDSFYQAANEAAISRLYGGIHFREAIENGKELGRKVGECVLDYLWQNFE